MANAIQMDVLKQIYRYWVIHDEDINIESIHYVTSKDAFDKEIKLLEISELIIVINNHLKITEAGKSKFRVVLTGGAYDLLHKGHIITLKEAKSLGDFLIVVIARDTTVSRKKRKPIHNEKDRVYLLNSVNVVDAAILGDEEDHMRVVRRIKPDIVAIGSDQDHLEAVLKDQLKDQGMFSTKIIRLRSDYEDMATTKLIKSIIERY